LSANNILLPGLQHSSPMSRYDWHGDNAEIERLKEAVEAARRRVIDHELYSRLDSLNPLLTFMQHHVFAVWDFMSLLKSLQRQLTCIDVPWVPTGPTASRRLINDIVLVEESDELGGGFISHFELYLHGMTQAGANRTAIDAFIGLVRGGTPIVTALKEAEAPLPSAEFTAMTWRLIETAPVHCQAAAFAFGREDLIPDMFEQVVRVNRALGNRLATFVDYLQRHIQVDSEEHTPMAMQMLAELCGNDERKWRQCEETVSTALTARCRLWDGILAAIETDGDCTEEVNGRRAGSFAIHRAGDM
jgi:Protein of unknown function (DUF3050)